MQPRPSHRSEDINSALLYAGLGGGFIGAGVFWLVMDAAALGFFVAMVNMYSLPQDTITYPGVAMGVSAGLATVFLVAGIVMMTSAIE